MKIVVNCWLNCLVNYGCSGFVYEHGASRFWGTRFPRIV